MRSCQTLLFGIHTTSFRFAKFFLYKFVFNSNIQLRRWIQMRFGTVCVKCKILCSYSNVGQYQFFLSLFMLFIFTRTIFRELRPKSIDQIGKSSLDRAWKSVIRSCSRFWWGINVPWIKQSLYAQIGRPKHPTHLECPSKKLENRWVLQGCHCRTE